MNNLATTSKAGLRTRLKAARLKLSPSYQRRHSQLIRRNLAQVTDWSKLTSLHVYEPIKFLAEADINPFINQLKRDYPGLRIYTSRLINDRWVVVDEASGQPCKSRRFDAILVPALGFDHSLHRIGYGGGYYDRLLALNKRALKIGVCFDKGLVDRVPTGHHDIALEKIVTDKQIYS